MEMNKRYPKFCTFWKDSIYEYDLVCVCVVLFYYLFGFWSHLWAAFKEISSCTSNNLKSHTYQNGFEIALEGNR